MDIEHVKDIAFFAREWSEAFNSKHTIAWDEDLCGMCAISAAFLFRELKRAGYRPVLAYSDYHFFVLIDDYIVDVTATQFTVLREVLPSIVVRHKNEVEAKEYFFWRVTKTFTSLRQMFIFQNDFLGWCHDQRATYNRINEAVLD